MLDQLLPARVDNTYRGHKLALWVFGVVVFVKATQSVMSIFNTYAVATGWSPSCSRCSWWIT